MAPAAFEPSTPSGRAGLAALLAAPAEAVVALDFDGTLAPIVADPDQAHAHPGAAPALARLAPLLRAVVVVTGRPAQDAVRLGGFAQVAGLEHLVVLGHYGAERWEAATGELRATQVHPGVAAIRAELPLLLRRLSAPEGSWIEDKGRSLAVHTRRTAEPEAALEQLREPLALLAAAHGLVVEPGRMVVELRPPGADKGGALTEFLHEREAGSVLYAGDDLGDLAAYAAVRKLRGEGLPGLLVCSGPVNGEPPVREVAEQADLVVAGPAGVVELLENLYARAAS
ncbi:trehalose 6-phosphate phosphatase [Kitasatospora sp. MAP12-15]|uniref:trehalose-phosphatase n=1 Tax=unclassified Kitasatospora TaxID=2633591 RepID=UPI00247307AB|nr:trehalose-phosphatase [Kitasatospora sp. MAP12-44]MDH6112257.1 trehalose 6-phosphate phosphatase [Kitasatospora sp. MAP12-44]